MKALIYFLLFMSFGVSAMAQAGVKVSGTAEDEAGAVIPGEALTLTSKAGGKALKTVSDGAGHFSFQDVPPGTYLLKGSAEGFKKTEMSLTVGDHPLSDVTITMPVGASEETVIVSASSSQRTSSENNSDSVYVNSDLINSLPSQSQDVLPVLSNFLSPAAQGLEGPSIVVDGIEGSDLDVPTESLKRISINKNPYSPEFRRPGLGRIEVTTRNGSTGHFDGSVSSYYRNDALDAQNAFADQKPRLSRRLFEGTLGGPFPIKHARFFLSASRLMNEEDAVVNAITPQGPVIQNVPTTRTNTNLLGRLDLRPNKLNTISLFYGFRSNPENDFGVGGLRLASHQRSDDDRRHKGQLFYTALISPTFLNTFRFDFERRHDHSGILALAPEIDVNGAFVGGPNQTAEERHATKMEIQDILSYGKGAHTLHFGGGFRPKKFDVTDSTNFGGTFTFAGLPNFVARNPVQFQVIQGNPVVAFSQNEAYGFFQDEIKLSPTSTLMVGVRYDWQQNLKDTNNVAPRAAFAFSPDKDGKTVFRLGAGIFYEHLSDSVTEQTQLLNGAQASEFIVSHPSFPAPILRGVLPSIWQLAPGSQAPYLFQGSFGVERSLWSGARATLEYQYLRGVHLFRARDLNAPVAGIRPDPDLFLVRQVESTGSMRSNALIATLQGHIGKPVKIKAQYTFSHSDDDSDGALVLPANSRDLESDWGRSLFDIRHRLTIAATSNLPAHFRVGALFTAKSGLPFNITTGLDNNGDAIVNDRPVGVKRNSGFGPDFSQLDLRFTKSINLYTGAAGNEGGQASYTRMEFSIDAFNVFNHANLADVIGVTSSPRFGLATTALQPRTIQLSVKLIFRENTE